MYTWSIKVVVVCVTRVGLEKITNRIENAVKLFEMTVFCMNDHPEEKTSFPLTMSTQQKLRKMVIPGRSGLP